MRWPSFLKFKLPQWKKEGKAPGLFKTTLSFYGAWKKFIRQIPPESRSPIKSYPHFIVMGGEKSGKSELIQGLIDQSQDLYPFDTSFTETPGVQFYIGPHQIIEEISFATLENRSIKARKQVIRLWKKLHSKSTPTVVVAYSCEPGASLDLKELNKLAQLIAGKVSLVAEITKKPIKLNLALTHLDKIPGYLEFARFLKQNNLNFTIPLTSNFEPNMLSARLRAFAEEHLSLILTTVSQADYAKILQFFREMPHTFSLVEEFLRILISRISFKESVDFEKLSLTSSQEGGSSFGVFEWVKRSTTPLFFRYPMLKHQIGASLLCLVVAAFLMGSFVGLRQELAHVKKGVELLDLLQFSVFEKQIISKYGETKNEAISRFFGSFHPYFFRRQMSLTKDHLAHRIRKHLIEPAFRKTILENRGEFKYLYFLGLMQATSENHIGRFIYKNADEWSKGLGLDQNLIKTYVSCSSNCVPVSLLTESKASPFLPLTSLDPWFSFLRKVKEITDQPIFIEQPFEDEGIVRETEKLLAAISRLRGDPLIFAIATLLDENGFNENENIKTVHWIGENIDALENFLLFVKQTAVPSLNVQGMSLTQFFAKLKEITLLSGGENELYNFALRGHLFSFDSTKWTNHVVVYNVERAIQEYIAMNADGSGAIFFSNTLEVPEPSVLQTQDSFSFVKTQMVLPGRYSRGDFEKKVRSPAEKLVSFIDSLPINPEEKKRFSSFLTREAMNYIKNYQAKYVKFFDAYDIDIESLKSLKKLLAELSKPAASFYDFLRTVQHQTSMFSEPILAMQHTEQFNEFAFLDAIFQQKEGQALIDNYQRLMGELLSEIENPSSRCSTPTALISHLSPVAQISLAILHHKPDSYSLRMQECLSQMGIPERFQYPFRKPLLLVYKLGLQELKKSIENLWASKFQPTLYSLWEKFPFNSCGSGVATLEEIEKVLSPASPFYQELREAVSTLTVRQNGAWVPLHEEAICLDQTIHTDLDRISYMLDLLWDGEGKPKPLTLKMKSVPFERESDDSVPSLCYVVAGEESMYNFNQDPSWQTLSIAWWKSDSSYIGMELFNKNTNAKSYRNLQGPPAPWSFFSLLKQGRENGDNLWAWSLPGKEGKDARTVSFRFEINPYTIFQPPGSL